MEEDSSDFRKRIEKEKVVTDFKVQMTFIISLPLVMVSSSSVKKLQIFKAEIL